MQKIYNTAIIGGGASGLLTAVELLSGNDAINFNDLILLERNDRVGKKLIATGNGQGNLTNDNLDGSFYYGEKEFIDVFINRAKQINLKDYFYNLGIPLESESNGKVYPLSKQASAVLDIIRDYLKDKNCNIMTDFYVSDIIKQGDKYILISGNNRIYAKNVVVAVGGMASKQFGTDGSSYKLCEKLNHKRTELYPSLVQLKTDTTYIRGLKGLKEYVKITSYEKDKQLKSFTGDILFTDFGVSGNAVFQISSTVCDKKNARLIVEFLPSLSENEVIKILEKREKLPYFNNENLLSGVINKRIGQAIIKASKNKDILSICHTLKHFELKVVGSLGFNYSQVTRGGIVTKDFNPYTMESKINKNFYCTGEVLDIDGDCGGYNLTFAFISGILSAKNIKEKNHK